MNETTYTKLGDLIDQQFTVEHVHPYVWKTWDNENKKMLSSDSHVKGYSKKYPIQTDKGLMDVGTGQLGNMLEATFKDGKADIIGKTFSVKSNGETGLKVRYYLNLVTDAKPDKPAEEPLGL